MPWTALARGAGKQKTEGAGACSSLQAPSRITQRRAQPTPEGREAEVVRTRTKHNQNSYINKKTPGGPRRPGGALRGAPSAAHKGLREEPAAVELSCPQPRATPGVADAEG